MDRKSTDALLCQCLRTEVGGELIGRLGELKDSDWDSLLRESDRHGLTPLLYCRLKTLGCDARLPDRTMQRLHEVYLHSTAVNMRRYHRLSTILKALKEQGVPVIVLKGAHLAEVVYGGVIGLRTMCDVDLLLRKEDLQRSRERLLDVGCSQPGNGALNLDLHWNIEDVDRFGHHGLAIAEFNIDLEGIWKRARPAVIGGVQTLVLAPEDLLIHLCMHLSFHHLFWTAGLRGLCDLRQTIQHYRGQIEWQKVQRRAESWGVRNAVFLTLLLAGELLDADVPDEALASLGPGEFDPAVKQWALSQMFDPGSAAHCSLSLLFWHLLSPESLREKGQHLLRLVSPPPQFRSRQSPSPQRVPRNRLYYLSRLTKKPWPYLWGLWKILIRDEEMTTVFKQQQRNIAMRKWLLQNRSLRASRHAIPERTPAVRASRHPT